MFRTPHLASVKTEEKFMFLLYEFFLGLSRGEKIFGFGKCYGLSRQQEKIAVILYPTTHDKTQEARIVLSEPTFGTGQATVVLRPVNLLHLEKLVTGARMVSNEREKKGFARQLVFGEG